MSYNPYGQQPYGQPQQQYYDPNQQAYQAQYQTGYQAQYQAPGTYTAVPQGPPAQPPKKTWALWKIVLIVVFVVVMLIVAFFACAVFAIWATPFEGGPGDGGGQAPASTMIVSTFTNPKEGTTNNSGGWMVRVLSVMGGAPDLSKVSLTLKRGQTIVAAMNPVSSSSSDLSYTTGSVDWYLKSSATTTEFVDGSTLKDLDEATAKDVQAGEFETIQGASIIYIDSNGNGKLDSGDSIFVYRDADTDGTPDALMGDTMNIAVSAGAVGSCKLT